MPPLSGGKRISLNPWVLLLEEHSLAMYGHCQKKNCRPQAQISRFRKMQKDLSWAFLRLKGAPFFSN